MRFVRNNKGDIAPVSVQQTEWTQNEKGEWIPEKRTSEFSPTRLYPRHLKLNSDSDALNRFDKQNIKRGVKKRGRI